MRLLALTIWLCTVLMMLIGTGASAQSTLCQKQAIDKAYEEILYYYFQADLFQALTLFERLEQQCPQKWQDITNPGIDPLLLKGGISLSYGLDDQAAEIFRTVLDKNDDPYVQTNAWFLLGKSLFKKHLFLDAKHALERIPAHQAQQHLTQTDKDEWIYLQAQISQMSKGQADYLTWIDTLSPDSIYVQYLQYNYAVQLLNQGHTGDGIALLQRMGLFEQGLIDSLFDDWFSPLRVQSESELAALQDRVSLTLGYALLNERKPYLAMTAFQQVHMDSLDTDAALLGIGWAAAQQEEYQVALSAWQQLQSKQYNNEYVLEAFLASAYAYEKAYAPTQALATLQLALERFKQQTQKLQDSQKQLHNRFFIDLAAQPIASQSIPPHLAQIMLSDQFERQITQLRETLHMSKQLAGWRERLETFNLMLDERQSEGQSRIQQLQQNKTLERLPLLSARRDALQQQLQGAKQDVFVLADEQQLQWLTRLKQANKRLQNITDRSDELNQKPVSVKYQARLKRLEGILVWNATELHRPRLRQIKKALKSLDEKLAQARAQQQRLQQHLSSTPDYAAQRNRIKLLQVNLLQQWQLAQKLQQRQLAQLQTLFEQSIEAQLSQLDNYQLQAQLAIVRLNDKAYRKAQADKQQGKGHE